MKYYLIVGEASGDLHASNLMKAIRERDNKAQFRFFGGDLMAAVGGTLVKHYRELAYMGFVQVCMFMMGVKKASRILGIPENHKAFAIMGLGMPAFKYQKYTNR